MQQSLLFSKFKRKTKPPTHSQRVPSLLETGTDFSNSDRSLLKSKVKTYLFSAAYHPHLLTVLYNRRSCPRIPPELRVLITFYSCGYHAMPYNSSATNSANVKAEFRRFSGRKLLKCLLQNPKCTQFRLIHRITLKVSG